MTDTNTLIKANQNRWENCKVNPNKQATFDSVARRLTASDAVARYKAVEARTGVPWWFVAVVHEREASQRWTANIAQGDRYDRKSTHVPVGRGPFKSWEDAAVDALTNCPPHAARNKDWSAAGALSMLERYNGLGYANRGVPSPYIWAGTNQYTKGKYVADHVYDPNAVDSQLGCAGLLKAMNVFSKPVITPAAAGATAAGAIVAGGAAATVAAKSGHHWGYIVAGLVVTAILAWFLIHTYLNKGKTDDKNLG